MATITISEEQSILKGTKRKLKNAPVRADKIEQLVFPSENFHSVHLSQQSIKHNYHLLIAPSDETSKEWNEVGSLYKSIFTDPLLVIASNDNNVDDLEFIVGKTFEKVEASDSRYIHLGTDLSKSSSLFCRPYALIYIIETECKRGKPCLRSQDLSLLASYRYVKEASDSIVYVIQNTTQNQKYTADDLMIVSNAIEEVLTLDTTSIYKNIFLETDVELFVRLGLTMQNHILSGILSLKEILSNCKNPNKHILRHTMQTRAATKDENMQHNKKTRHVPLDSNIDRITTLQNLLEDEISKISNNVTLHAWKILPLRYQTIIMGDRKLDCDTSSEWKPELKYDFDPITSDDEIVTVDLGGTPKQCLKIGDALQHLVTMARVIPDYRKHIPSIRNMEMDDDDVIICAFAKSGTHWLWEITSMLRNGKADYHGKEKTSVMLEFIPTEVLRASPKPRIYNTHFTPQRLPKQIFDKKCKILFLQRNPKDVLVSFFPFLQGHKFIDSTIKWEEFVSKYMELEVESSLLNWFYYTRQWFEFLKEGHDNIYCLAYEDMKDDPVREITKLAKFLEIEENSDLVKDIAVKSSFQNMKQAASSKQKTFAINNKEVAKKITNLTYRKGEVGDWKNYFTVAVNEKFDALYAKKMKGIDFIYRYSI
ncbi:uncharacterized protein LOC127724409 isoform X4 [Mytilus californianus]|uniref:uncharacterized protein LOC127724409 isoform X4 n=1 Tax=Mytilus californianus TaxID=6549 RepID=UPI002247F63F|nr:uncharacterized protein LOC127724409 isoform X4 [Mytilus californianus]